MTSFFWTQVSSRAPWPSVEVSNLETLTTSSHYLRLGRMRLNFTRLSHLLCMLCLVSSSQRKRTLDNSEKFRRGRLFWVDTMSISTVLGLFAKYKLLVFCWCVTSCKCCKCEHVWAATQLPPLFSDPFRQWMQPGMREAADSGVILGCLHWSTAINAGATYVTWITLVSENCIQSTACPCRRQMAARRFPVQVLVGKSTRLKGCTTGYARWCTDFGSSCGCWCPKWHSEECSSHWIDCVWNLQIHQSSSGSEEKVLSCGYPTQTALESCHIEVSEVFFVEAHGTRIQFHLRLCILAARHSCKVWVKQRHCLWRRLETKRLNVGLDMVGLCWSAEESFIRSLDHVLCESMCKEFLRWHRSQTLSTCLTVFGFLASRWMWHMRSPMANSLWQPVTSGVTNTDSDSNLQLT